MKVEERILDYRSNVVGERVGMTIDESALSHIMSVLTDLYSDPEMAVLREYATNALDAHVDAGTSRPIEVTLPTPLSPFVRIRDYGTGLDADDIRNVFSRYGTSTKRESNDVVGMLGLGCKSALTYSDSFTLTGVKDGRATEVLVSRDEDGAGSMVIVEERATEEPSGVLVTVPAKTSNAFEVKARSLFRFWTPGTVLVNGEEPKRVDGLWLSDSILMTTEVDTDTIVMGNVPYPIPGATDSPSHYVPGRGYVRYHVVGFVGIGEVTFTPSRESLQTTKRTTATIAHVRAQRAALLEESIRRQIMDAATPQEAIRLLREGRAIGYKGVPKYKGRDVPQSLDRTPRDANGARRQYANASDVTDSFLVGMTSSRKKSGERTYTLAFENLSLIFEGFDARELSPTKREKLAAWFERESLTPRPCVFVNALTSEERFWLSGADVRIEKWSDVDAIKIERANRPALEDGRPRGSYVGIVNGVSGDIQAADIDTSRPIYWTQGNVYSLSAHDALRRSIVAKDSATIVALPANRIAKFERDFPTAVNLEVAARRAASAWYAAQDGDALKAYAYSQSYDSGRIAKMDAVRIDDPSVRECIRIANIPTNAIRDGLTKYGAWLDARPSYDPPMSFERDYPLACGTGRLHEEHFYIYVNAAYAARIAEEAKEGR